MVKKKKEVIDLENERMGLFMTENSFDYLQTDNVQEVIIYKVNIIKTKTHDLYGQSKTKDKVFYSPVPINVMITVGANSQKYYGDGAGGISREDTGPLVFGVYSKELEEKKLDIARGDYVKYNMGGEQSRYYEIEIADNVIDTTDKTIGGFKPYWRKITAVPVKEDVVPFLSETKGN